MRTSTWFLAGLASCALAIGPAPALAQYGATDGEWRTYAGDQGSTKYSPLDQIDATNFDDLQIAWRWKSADGALDLAALREQRSGVSINGFQATPLMVGGTLYLSTAMYQAAAVDAGTGETVWVYDPQIYRGGAPTHGYGSRGVAYWTDGEEERIFWGTSEGYCRPSTPRPDSRRPVSGTPAASISLRASPAPPAET
jgi:quinoprotein glucose dehydrogenase